MSVQKMATIDNWLIKILCYKNNQNDKLWYHSLTSYYDMKSTEAGDFKWNHMMHVVKKSDIFNGRIH